MKIITIPHTSLRQICPPVTRPDRRLKRVLADLQATLIHSDLGVGLAAPQIGSHYRVFGINLPKNANDKTPIYRYFINPSITKHAQEEVYGRDPDGQQADLEGCLSIPRIYAPVARYPWIDITYDTLENDQLTHHQEHLADFAARVFQHEADHLDGILFLDHALRQGNQLYRDTGGEKLTKITPESLLEEFGQF